MQELLVAKERDGDECEDDAPYFQRDVMKTMMILGAVIVGGCVIAVVLALTLPSPSYSDDAETIPFYYPPAASFYSPIPSQTQRTSTHNFNDNVRSDNNIVGSSKYPSRSENTPHTSSTLPPYDLPCVYNQNTPQNCVQRFVECGKTEKDGSVVDVLGPTANTFCSNWRVYVGETYIVQFYDSNRKCWEVKMAVGECWGINPISGAEYSCQGKCGAGCGNVDCGAWARDCLRHDACSWFFGAAGGAKDTNCGEAYNLAMDDFLASCPCNGSNRKDKSVCNLR